MIELSRRGVRTALVCSEPFLEMARTQARVFGEPDLSLLVVPHPLGGIPVDDVRARAESALPGLIRLAEKKEQ
jgi:hypothetical protein